MPNKTDHSSSALVTIKDISFSTSNRTLFYDVNLSVHQGEILAITGPSGCGKSTLLKIILGIEEAEVGNIFLSKHATISYFPQIIKDMDIDLSTTVHDLFYKTRGLVKIDAKKQELEAQLTKKNINLNTGLVSYQNILEEFEKRGGYTIDNEIGRMLAGLQLDSKKAPNINPQTTLAEVSSGQLTRLLIGQALFSQADLLVLDDPTSHLDISSIQWLTNYLRGTKQGVIVATNNLSFVNKCVNRVLEITDFGRVLSFQGNYAEFLEKKTELLEAERKKANAKLADYERLKATYMKFKGKGIFKRSASMAQVGRALQTRMQRVQNEYQNLPGSKSVERTDRVRQFSFECGQRSGNNILSLKKPLIKYGKFIGVSLPDLEMTIMRGEFIRFTGSNGTGKSTLLRAIYRSAMSPDYKPDKGQISLGENITVGYYAPDIEEVDKEILVLESVTSIMIQKNEGHANSILQYWGFNKNDILTKTIKQLSAGERKQLAFARLMAQSPNFLILDEPTDHLKQNILNRLIDALFNYKGTLILVSHDQEFVNKLKIDKTVFIPEIKAKSS